MEELPITPLRLRQQETLALALIEYIHSRHVLFVDNVSSWQEFHTSSPENFEKFADLSPKELCEEFVNKVLPHIYEFELTASQLESFELLELHSEYRRVEQGYQRLLKSNRLSACREPILNIDYCIQPPTFEPPVSPCRELETFSITPQLQNIHTVVSSNPRQIQKAGVGFQFSPRCHSLISAILSDTFELSGCVLLEHNVIRQRLRDFREHFEQNAVLPQNYLKVDDLLRKIQNLCRLRRTLTRVIDESFI